MAASIAALLDLTGKVLSYLNNVKEAGAERTKCATEAATLYALLTTLKYRIEANSGDPWFTAIRSLGTENGPLDQFKAAIELLASKLKPEGGIKKIGHALTWTFDKAEINGILSRIERLKSLVNLALANDLLCVLLDFYS